MEIRKFKNEDIPFMLEWMKDHETNKNFIFDFASMDEAKVKKFIEDSLINNENAIHLAVVDDNDEYMGTISLKNIDRKNMSAEYAICMRKEARGKGYAQYATEEILKKAFFDLNLNRVYLDVLVENIPANKFYQKVGFIFEGQFKQQLLKDNDFKDVNWYRILKNEYLEGRKK